jgi:hypothetical protein
VISHAIEEVCNPIVLLLDVSFLAMPMFCLLDPYRVIGGVRNPVVLLIGVSFLAMSVASFSFRRPSPPSPFVTPPPPDKSTLPAVHLPLVAEVAPPSPCRPP